MIQVFPFLKTSSIREAACKAAIQGQQFIGFQAHFRLDSLQTSGYYWDGFYNV